MPRRRLTCPVCGTRMLPIVYGFPGPDLQQAAEQGEVMLGGCVVSGDDPQWWCPECEETWPPRPAPSEQG